MKILMVNKFLFPKGGSEIYMFNLSEYLISKGHDIIYFGTYNEKNTVKTNPEYLINSYDSKKGLRLSSFFAPLTTIYSFEARLKIKKLVKKENPDIIHLNNYNFHITPSILFEIKKYKIPIVQTIHDPQNICPNHRLYIEHSHTICEACKGESFFNCVKRRCIQGSLLKSIIAMFESRIYHSLGIYDKLIDLYISPSEFMRNKYIEFGQDGNKIRVITNFIENFNSTDFDKKNYILYFGRLSKEKGIYTLIEAIKLNPTKKFIIAGAGPLEDIVNCVENIDYIGFVKGKELHKLIGQALYSIYPSECYENCPLSVLESQALGTPVIGADIGGIPELIDNDNDGLLFESGNVADLSDCIQKLYNDRQMLEDYSMKCKEKARKFNAESYYKKITKIYKDAIAK